MSTLEAQTAIRFTALGKPQGKGSKRALPVKGRPPVIVDSNRRAGPWAAIVSMAARDAYQGALIRDAVLVRMWFVFARPQAHYGTGRNRLAVKPSAPAQMMTTPDVDKLARCAIDALTGIVLADDKQIATLHASKLYGEPERLEVEVTLL